MRFIIIIVIFLVIGVIFMLGYYSWSGGLRYDRYSSKDPELNIKMDYISGWSYSESRGSYGSYAQVQFIEPRRKDKNLSASMVVTVKRSSKIKFQPQTIKGMEDNLLEKRLQFENAKVVSKSKTKLLGIEAIDIELAYKTLDKDDSIDAKLIPVRERIVIFKRGDRFYTLRYNNTEEEFKKFDRAFTHCIKTLRFK